jgi:hypothetical protein
VRRRERRCLYRAEKQTLVESCPCEHNLLSSLYRAYCWQQRFVGDGCECGVSVSGAVQCLSSTFTNATKCPNSQCNCACLLRSSDFALHASNTVRAGCEYVICQSWYIALVKTAPPPTLRILAPSRAVVTGLLVWGLPPSSYPQVRFMTFTSTWGGCRARIPLVGANARALSALRISRSMQSHVRAVMRTHAQPVRSKSIAVFSTAIFAQPADNSAPNARAW